MLFDPKYEPLDVLEEQLRRAHALMPDFSMPRTFAARSLPSRPGAGAAQVSRARQSTSLTFVARSFPLRGEMPVSNSTLLPMRQHSEMFRQIGFHSWPETAEDFVKACIADRAMGA